MAGLSAAAVLSPGELSELQRQQQQQQQQATEDVEAQQGLATRSSTSTSTRSKTSTGMSRGVWLALCLSLLALAGTVATTYWLIRERAKEHEESLHLAAGTSNNSTNALGMARAAQDRSIKLEQALDTLNVRLALVEGQAAAADKRFMAQCEALLAVQEEEEAEKERAAAATTTAASAMMHTQYVCQGQSGWQLACPAGGGAPTVIQALVGRFTSAPDGPCVDGHPRTQLALCLASVDLTAQVRRAAGAGTVVQATPMELLAEAMERDPCPRSYKQLQILYQCPAVSTTTTKTMDAAARTERCRQALNAGAASGAGSGMIAPAPGAAVGPVATGVTSPQKELP